MKILIFTDSHGDYLIHERIITKAKKENVNLIICGGDVTIFGNHSQEIIAHLDSANIPIFFIHGNHEDEDEIKRLVLESQNITWLHNEILLKDDFAFIGFGGGGFSETEPEFLELTQKLKHDNVILITHQPPYGTQLDCVNELFSGNKDFREFIEKQQPLFAISGHIHETFQKTDTIKKTKLINPGPKGVIIEI